MYSEKLIKKIKAVLDSDLTAYRIAKDVGYAGANPVHDLRNGKSDIYGMKLSTAMEFEKLYEKMEEIEMKTWEFKGYTVHEETDLLRFENEEGDIIGYVTKNGDEEVKALENDEMPIEDKWEDGIGNTLEIIGWGNEAPADIETMYERLRAVLKVDGEDEKFMTLYDSAEEIEQDLDMFERNLNVHIDKLSFPIVVLDDQNASSGHVFEKDEMDDLKDKALDYFKRK